MRRFTSSRTSPALVLVLCAALHIGNPAAVRADDVVPIRGVAAVPVPGGGAESEVVTISGPPSRRLMIEIGPAVLAPIGDRSVYTTPGVHTALSFGGVLNDWVVPGLSVGFGWQSTPIGGPYRSNGYVGTVAPRVTVPFGPLRRLTIHLTGEAGVYGAMVDVTSTFVDLPDPDGFSRIGPMIGGMGSLGLALFRGVDLYLGAGYRRLFKFDDYLWVSLGLRVYSRDAANSYHHLNRRALVDFDWMLARGEQIEITSTETEELFPILFKYYEQNGLGSMVVTNTSRFELEDLTIRYHVNDYSAPEQVVATVERLRVGESAEVELMTLLSENVISLTETTRAVATVEIDYWIDRLERSFRTTGNITLRDRNAIRWDDSRKVVSFITPRDDEVKLFANQAVNIVRAGGIELLPDSLEIAMSLHQSMRAARWVYVVDPTSSSYAEFSDNANAVDYVQFPRQTLQYGGGDCDDLSTAFSAMLESVGVETALVTVPGHIFPAFRVEGEPEELVRLVGAGNVFVRQDDGSYWIPVEVTALEAGFLDAVAVAAAQWRSAMDADSAEMIPVRQTWSGFPPVQAVTTLGSVQSASPELASALFIEARREIVASYYRDEIARLTSRLDTESPRPRDANRLGVLYARSGRLEEAYDLFRQIVDLDSGYTSARLNLANVLLLLEQPADALEHYAAIVADRPANTDALVGAALASRRLGRLSEAEEYYKRLSAIDASMAERYAYLASDSSGARASGASLLLGPSWAGGRQRMKQVFLAAIVATVMLAAGCEPSWISEYDSFTAPYSDQYVVLGWVDSDGAWRITPPDGELTVTAPVGASGGSIRLRIANIGDLNLELHGYEFAGSLENGTLPDPVSYEPGSILLDELHGDDDYYSEYPLNGALVRDWEAITVSLDLPDTSATDTFQLIVDSNDPAHPRATFTVNVVSE